MKKINILYIILICVFPFVLNAQENNISVLEQVVVVSSKEGQELRKLPTSVSLISAKQIDRNRIEGIRDLSTFVPNLFIPDYGSKYTSAVYIRGVGSRLGNSAIGMYVDNVPYLDKTSFDFELFDINHIEVLRGPQGTLYGRNSMGGLINIYTLSPWDYQGTKAKFSSGSYGKLQAQLSHYTKFNNRLALSVGGYYSSIGGFFRNTNPDYSSKYSNISKSIYPKYYEDNAAGAMQSASVRVNLGWRPSEKLSFNYIGSYEFTDQNGYAYGKYNFTTNLPDTINYNDVDYYKRNVFNHSLRMEYHAAKFKISSTTGYQYLKDYLLLDQDFTARSVFTLLQNQKLNSINEEVTIRSTTNNNLLWIGGINAFYQNVGTVSKVTFKEDGIAMIQQNMNNSGIPFLITLTDESIPIYGDYVTRNYGLAGFVQSTYNNLFIKGLSLSAGWRIDYEHASLKHFTNGMFNYSIKMGPTVINREKNDTIAGKESMSFTQLLPKFSLRYEKNKNVVYAAISKGYKAGGYNLQMFSDLMETQMRSMSPPEFDIQSSTSFKPEYSWNYEIGGRISVWESKINAGLTFFLLDIKDQQLTEFAPNGQGRMIKNAGESESKGIEFDANTYPVNGLRLGINYGFTHNKFTNYKEQIDDLTTIDYSGKYVPFVPMHTFAVSADYSINLNKSFIDRFTISGQYSGAGKIYWTEANDVSQKFYSLLSGKISAEKGVLTLSIWARNLLDTKYTTFYFKTFGNSFGQLGKPVHWGIDLNIKF